MVNMISYDGLRQVLKFANPVDLIPKMSYLCNRIRRNGGMVDTKDLKSFGLYRLCGFESHFLYKIGTVPIAVPFFLARLWHRV